MNAALMFVLWPLLSAFILFCMGPYKKLSQILNILFHFVWAWIFFMLFHEGGQFSEPFKIAYSWNWLPLLKSQFLLGLDAFNLPILGLQLLLSFCLAFYSLGKDSINSSYLSLFSILNAASVGSLLAADALTFYVFWEFMLIPMYFLIGKWGGKNRIYAALKFFVYTMVGSLFMLLAIGILATRPELTTLSWHEIRQLKLPFEGWTSLQSLVCLGFLGAFIVKVPVWPLHTWLPDAHSEAPTGASVILAGILLKLGIYGMLRWCFPLFPQATMALAPYLISLSVLGIILGALAAWKQKDVKRLIAYSSVSHLGFMVLGLFALQEESIQGALFQNLSHGLSTGALFLIFGIIYDRTHTRELADYGGLASQNSFLAITFLISGLASMGLPGLCGFIGEFVILSGTYFSEFKVAALLASLGVLLGALYSLDLLKKILWGPVGGALEAHPIKTLEWNEVLAILPLVLGMFLLGIYPGWLFAFAQPSMGWLLQGFK